MRDHLTLPEHSIFKLPISDFLFFGKTSRELWIYWSFAFQSYFENLEGYSQFMLCITEFQNYHLNFFFSKLLSPPASPVLDLKIPECMIKVNVDCSCVCAIRSPSLSLFFHDGCDFKGNETNDAWWVLFIKRLKSSSGVAWHSILGNVQPFYTHSMHIFLLVLWASFAEWT